MVGLTVFFNFSLMPQIRVLSITTHERILVDKVKPREHLHVSGQRFTDSMLADLVRDYGSSAVDMPSKTVPKVETTIETVPIEENEVEEKKEHWKAKEARLKREAANS